MYVPKHGMPIPFSPGGHDAQKPTPAAIATAKAEGVQRHAERAAERPVVVRIRSRPRPGTGRESVGVFGDFQARSSASSSHARTPPSGSRSCASESRSRTVTVSSSSVCSSIVNANGVPISSWRR